MRYDQAATGPVDHSNLPDAQHTRGIRAELDEHEQRVTAFFNKELNR